MARRRRPAARRTSTPSSEAVFINVPYDKKYESLYLALIAGLCGFGLIPRAAVEIPGGQRRLDRIFELLRNCRYSFHDLSRVQLDRRQPPPTPRFNMPFELGLAVAWAETGSHRHAWFVLEAVRHRLSKSLSDLDGTDPYIHNSSPRDLFLALTNALVRTRQQPTVTQLEAIYDDLKQAVPILKKELKTDSLFAARPFLDLVVAATRSAHNRRAAAPP
jgi:hypothetical protein